MSTSRTDQEKIAALVEALENLLHDPMAERTVDAAKRALAQATGQPERKGP